MKCPCGWRLKQYQELYYGSHNGRRVAHSVEVGWRCHKCGRIRVPAEGKAPFPPFVTTLSNESLVSLGENLHSEGVDVTEFMTALRN